MLRQLKIDWRLNGEGVFIIPSVAIFGAVMGVAMCLLMIKDEQEWFCLGTVLAAVMVVMLGMFLSSYMFSQECSLALSMGCTRKDFLTSFLLRQTIVYVVSYGVLLAICVAESAFYPAYYPGATCFFSVMEVLLDWRVVTGVYFLWMLLPIGIIMLIRRFGKAVTIPLYFMWLAVCILPSQLIETEAGAALVSALAVVPSAIWWVLYAAVVLALLGGVRYSMKRFTVK